MKKLKYKNAWVGLVGAMFMLLSACQTDEAVPDNTPKTRELTVQEQKTIGSSNSFAFQAFAKLSEGQDQNVFISPLSISMALGMAYNGAGSTTKEAMRQTLGFDLPTDEEINQSFKSLSGLLQGIDKEVTFSAANSSWYNNRFELQAPFVEKNETYFDATVQGLDFSSPAAKTEINNWVANKTNGKIKTIVDQVRPEHALFLMNAIYFKGAWTYQFDKTLTQPAQFHLANGSTVNHPFMTLKKGKYLLHQDTDKTLIDLPYGNRQFSMMIVMPNDPSELDNLVQELNPQNLDTWLTAADSASLELHLPKFTMAYEKELNEMLKELGMGIAFSPQADFSHMVEGEAALAISKVKHKAFVEVNEEGTEAAAATSVGIVVTSLPPSVWVNRPFVFMIREKSSNAILFIGKLMQPE
ncbi:serpin family protein [Pontibacter harenae]|uniref:serpin family protein n=1 Tax=Pontibacter harenae TaxID=2894083 RepID=UPI001E4C0F4B|nr:serpin family protein [Pontibacter harenae]MCC9166943.1 serpin family protein [Pontibacter harenae]